MPIMRKKFCAQSKVGCLTTMCCLPGCYGNVFTQILPITQIQSCETSGTLYPDNEAMTACIGNTVCYSVPSVVSERYAWTFSDIITTNITGGSTQFDSNAIQIAFTNSFKTATINGQATYRYGSKARPSSNRTFRLISTQLIEHA